MITTLALHDLSSWGKSSLTVVLPLLEAMGIETAAIPTAVLSTQTDGFDRVLSEDMTRILGSYHDMIREYGYSFSAVYSGYLSTPEQVDDVISIMGKEEGIKLVDPVFGDDGMIYPTLSERHIERIRELVKIADIITPNITEAARLTGLGMKESYSNHDISEVVEKLRELGPDEGVVTGVPLLNEVIGNVAYSGDDVRILSYEDLYGTFPGGGDAFATILLGSILRGSSFFAAVKRAGDLVFETMKNAKLQHREHRLGIPLYRLIRRLGEV